MKTYTLQMVSLFEERDWKGDVNKIRLKRIIDFGENLSNNEREMIFQLTKKFVRIEPNIYLNNLIKSVKLMENDNSVYSAISTFYVLPILKGNDKHKIKSPQTVAYLFENDEITFLPMFQNKRIEVKKTQKQVLSEAFNNDASKIILVDDFLGTGKTSLDYINEINNNQRFNKEKFIFIYIAGMEQGIKNLKESGYCVYCNYIQKKGISDIQDQTIRDKYMKLMNSIETRFNIDNDFMLGYGKSEALIKLNRTPNNTFPVYWDESKNKNAPFWRR